VYDLGLVPNQVEYLDNTYPNVSVVSFDFSLVPEFLMNASVEILRPLFVAQVFDKRNATVVIWVDNGVLWTSENDVAMKTIGAQGYYATASGATGEINGHVVGLNKILYDIVLIEWKECVLKVDCFKRSEKVLARLLKRVRLKKNVAARSRKRCGRNTAPHFISDDSWFGHWMPFFSLLPEEEKINKKFSKQRVVPLTFSPKSKKRPIIEVGKAPIFKHKRKWVYPGLEQLVVLELYRVGRVQPRTSIVMPSHNQAHVLEKSISHLCENTVGSWDIVIILDASYDDSLIQVKKSLIKCMQNKDLMAARVVFELFSAWETSSDNVGYAMSDPTHYYIQVQPDIFVTQFGWNARLCSPMDQEKTVLAVSGRCGHSFSTRKKIGRCSSNFETDLSKNELQRNIFYVTPTVNRGPLAFRASGFQDMGFLNELVYFQGDDDHDLAARAQFKNWSVGYFPVGSYSPLNNSPSRSKTLSDITPKTVRLKDKQHLLARRARERKPSPKFDFERFREINIVQTFTGH